MKVQLYSQILTFPRKLCLIQMDAGDVDGVAKNAATCDTFSMKPRTTMHHRDSGTGRVLGGACSVSGALLQRLKIHACLTVADH